MLLAMPAHAGAATKCAGASKQPRSAAALTTARRATLCLLNAQRRAHGLRPLRESPKLDRAALGHSRDMVRRHYFEHGDFVGRIRRVRYSGSLLGENIAWGSLQFSSPAAIVRLWMHSPPHRANILRSGYRDIGIGLALGAPQPGVGRAATYTTDFGAP
jgi:uncharacterized protein YkwD